MSFVSAKSDSGPLRSVRYYPARIEHYGPADRYELHIRASVIVQLGDNGVVHLEVDDARALLAALPGVLDEHREAMSTAAGKAVA